jgi:divalent metal cation (Fe/Co/Zn/Cd) transporter
VPEITDVQTHLEPLAEDSLGEDVDADIGTVERVVRELTGTAPRTVRFLHTDEGLVAFLTLGLDPTVPLAEAHARASEIEERIRTELPEIADLIVHTEP